MLQVCRGSFTDSLSHLDVRVGIPDGSAVMHNNEWHAPFAEDGLLDFAKLVGCLLLQDKHAHSESSVMK